VSPLERRLRDHVAAAAQVPPETIAVDTPLLESRLLRSIMVLDLILLIEELRGRPLDPDAIRPESFRSIAAIVVAFFAEPAHA
jgi:acyl carrier protein